MVVDARQSSITAKAISLFLLTLAQPFGMCFMTCYMGDKSDYDVDVQVLSCCNGQLYGMVDVPAMGTVKP
jgi:hypothetical protein